MTVPEANPVVEQHTSTILPAAHLHFTDRLVEETVSRLGTLAELLSTPSRSDAGLVRGLRGVDRNRVLVMERKVIRSWIAAGGWSARRVDFPSVEPQTSPLSLPLPDWLVGLDGIAGMSAPTSSGGDQRRVWYSTEPGPWLGVCPWDVENLAAMIAARADQDSVFHAQNLPIIVSSAGPIGPAMHHHLARLLAHPRLDSRLLAAQHAATLAKQGRLHFEQLKERSLALFHHGDLSLARAAHGWAELAALSSLSVVWPSWRATLDASCSAAKKPAGLADLLRTTREHVPVLLRASHAEGMPESLRRLASERGSTKAVVEARALLGALEGGAR